jgi:hypothetical protein
MTDQASGPLRSLLEETAAEHDVPMKALTVLANQNDPFRVDTPAGHRDGAWLAMTARELGLGDRRIHLRGLHYMVLGRPKPDGSPYTNTEEDWTWLSAVAGKAARWLAYLPFDQIVDQRNAAPEVRIFKPPQPYGYLTVGLDVDVPGVEEIIPTAAVDGFAGAQPYKLVLFGEKSSLADVLGPIASEHKADLYLPTGEISDTLLYQMAQVGADDGRPMVVLCFSDADPAGWQMPISIARKLQAFKALGAVAVPHEDAYGNRGRRTVDFGALDVKVLRAALTPVQVREYGLPSTPLKDTERRGDAWRAAMGIEQTEIDALASLQPRLLRRIAREVLDPFFDSTLDRRVMEARSAWLAAAQAAIDAQLDAGHLERIRAEAAERLAAIRAELDALNDAMRIDAGDFDLPEPVVPEAEMDGRMYPLPLLDSEWPFAEQCRRLIASKTYRDQGGAS